LSVVLKRSINSRNYYWELQMHLRWPDKDPDEVLDYSVDWTNRLAGDTISTSAWSLVTASGIVLGAASNTTTKTTTFLSAGTEGATAIIRNRVTTAGGRTMDETISINIRSK
jgi:hypothetical protein